MTPHNGFKVVDRRSFKAAEEEELEAVDASRPEQSDKPTYVQLLEERTAHAQEQLARYVEAYKEEVQQNLAKTNERLQREAQRELARARGELVIELLEVLDNLDRSVQSLPASADDSIRQGLQLVRDQFFSTLARFGLSVVDAEGAPFDPKVHEAVATTPVSDPALDGRVAAVLKRGYRLDDQLLRPALVQVGRLAR